MEQFLQALGTGSGIAGIILGFHLWKLAPELRAIWRAIDRASQVRLLGIIASPHVSPEIKQEAASIVDSISLEETKAKKREVIPP